MNRSILNFIFLYSFVKDGVLHIRPTLTADRFGEDFLYEGTLDLWPEGCNAYADSNGCVVYVPEFAVSFFFFFFNLIKNPSLHWPFSNIRTCRHAGDEIINPIQSARIRTMQSFSFIYGIVEVRAKMPRGDWIWPGIINELYTQYRSII